MRRWILSAVVVWVAATAAPAQIAPDPTSDNAAARYVHWGKRIPPDVVNRLNQIDLAVPKFRAIKSGNSYAATPTQIRDALDRAKGVVTALVDAGGLQRCSFDFKPNSVGAESRPAAELGQQMLVAGKLLYADACRAWQDGDMQAAADRVAALIGMSRHMMHGTGGDSVSVMHGAMLLELALKASEEFEKAGRGFEGPMRAQVVHVLSLFPAEDSFGFRAAWRLAWRESSARLKRQVDAAELDKDVVKGVWEVRARSIKTELRLSLQRTQSKTSLTPPEFDPEFYLRGYRLGVETAMEIEQLWSDDARHLELENLLVRVNEEPTGMAVGVVGLFYDAYDRNQKLSRGVKAFVERGQ
ncbi:MAG: hypothetical protein ACOYN0_15405 [Phycisphaerales bacterium]